jgi:DNA-binding beta-propeller fold protein YncE
MRLERQIHLIVLFSVLAWLSGCCGGGSYGALIPEVTVSSSTYTTAGHPWQALVSSTGTVFVSVTADHTPGSATGVQVFVPASGSLQSSCVNELPSSLLGTNTYGANLSFFPGATDIAAGFGFPGAIFYHEADLLGCNASGYVVSQGSTSSNNAGTLAVAVTLDGKYAFVSNEYGVAPGATLPGNIGVVAIQRDADGNFTTGTTLIGQIATGGKMIAGMKLSPDGTRLYVTSEIAASGTQAAGSNNAVLSRSGCVQKPGTSNINGLLTVIDVATAEIKPDSGAILATVASGCSPVRMSETADGATLWVAARGDNRVLAFSTALLESNPNNALLGYADTGGTAPVGIQLFHNDQLLAVANSNRFNTGTANATILNVASPSSACVVQTIPTGLFPREITAGSDDATLYLTNFKSDTFQVIQTSIQ